MLVFLVLVTGIKDGSINCVTLRRERPHCLLIVVQCQADLLEIISTSARPAASRADCSR